MWKTKKNVFRIQNLAKTLNSFTLKKLKTMGRQGEEIDLNLKK